MKISCSEFPNNHLENEIQLVGNSDRLLEKETIKKTEKKIGKSKINQS